MTIYERFLPVDTMINAFLAEVLQDTYYQENFTALPAKRFETYAHKGFIHYAPLSSLEELKLFMDNLQKCYPEIANQVSAFTWSLLHEVGHLMTWDDPQSDDDGIREYIENADIDIKIKSDLYFLLPSEISATDWAIEFFKSQPDIVSSWDIEIQNTLESYFNYCYTTHLSHFIPCFDGTLEI